MLGYKGRSGAKISVRDTTMLSGWLFADLLLGLMMIFLVAAPPAELPPLPTTPTATATPTNTPTLTPTPTLTATPTNTPVPTVAPTPAPRIVLSREPRRYLFENINVAVLLSRNSQARQNERDRLIAEIKSKLQPLQGKQAGIVLTFGRLSNDGLATSLSAEFNSLLREAMPTVFDINTTTKNYIDGQYGNQNAVEIEVYLLE